MKSNDFLGIESPAYVLDEASLIRNLEKIAALRDRAGVQIILAFKAFALWHSFETISKYLNGATASSLGEARLCFEEMKSPAHTYAPAYIPREFPEIMKYSSHITFNSLSQFEKYKGTVLNHPFKISMGLRVNPEYSEVETDLYNPTALGSRLGVDKAQLKDGLPEFIEGIHFHALCENDSYTLEKTLSELERHFGHLLRDAKWVNMGGGHLITKDDYDVDHAVKLLRDFKEKYEVDIILEPGSAVAWRTGHLLTTVLDVIENHGVKTAVLDISFTCHQPDTLEMPYRPVILDAEDSNEGEFAYRLGGVSCLAGDRVEAYSFKEELQPGSLVVFEDMMHYTMVKTNMFNGVSHPSYAIRKVDGSLEVLRRFGYEDFKGRMG